MSALFKKKDKEEKKETETTEEVASLDESRRVKEEVAAPTVKLPKGEDAQSYGSIIRPHITEKAGDLEKHGKYIFRINGMANKSDVKKAIEKLYKVTVKNVHVLTMPSKARQVGKYLGKKQGFKKAIVTLKEGDRIEVTG